MTTFVISAFPGCGKNYCYNNLNGKGLSILDLDSSKFSYTKDEKCNNINVYNPEFPDNYISHIKENIGKYDIIFVSSDSIIRKALLENNISFILFYPHKSSKQEWIRRFKNRGNDEFFINFISDNWDSFIDELDSIDIDDGKSNIGGLIYRKVKKEVLGDNDYITVDYLYSLTDNSMGNLSSMYGN